MSVEPSRGPSDNDTVLSDGAGLKIGKYPVVKRIGKGGMGEVWLGEDPESNLPVAIKAIPVFLPADDADVYVKRLQREARTASQLDSDHVVRVHDWALGTELSWICQAVGCSRIGARRAEAVGAYVLAA